MASISWKSPVSGGWTVGSNWSSGTVPGSGDDVAISVAGGYTVTLNAAISINSLTISDTSAALAIASGATESIAGNLSNSGNLQLDAGGSGGSTLAVGGTLTNTGTFQLGNGGISATATVTIAALNNTGTLNVFGQNAVGGAAATLNVGSAAGFGSAGVVTGAVNLTGVSAVEFASGEITSIASGAQLNIQTSAGFIEDAGALGSNSALVGLASNAGQFLLRFGAALTTSGNFANSGFTGVDDAGSGTSSLTVSGTLTNSGTFRVGNSGISTALVVNITALNNTGSLELNGSNTSLSGSATLNVGSAAGFGSAGVVTGAVNLTGVSAVEFASGEITSIASGAQLNIQTSAGFIEDAGALGSNSALVGLASNAGQFLLRFGAALTTSGNFANSGFTGVDDAGSGTSSLTVSGTLTNSGTFRVGNSGISTALVVNITALNNTGSLELNGSNTSLSGSATLNVGSAAGFGSAGVVTGAVNLTGVSAVEFASGEITSIASGAQLNIQTSAGFIEDAGALGSNSALVGLASNAGQFLLRFGAALTTSGNFANSGFTGVDDAGSGTSSLTVSGTLTNSGTFRVGNSGISTALVVNITALNNTGSLELNGSNTSLSGSATLNVGSAAGFGSAGVVTGAVNLTGVSAVEFASGEITSIASGAQLNIQTSAGFIEDAGALGSNSALVGLASNAGQFLLRFGAALTTSGNFANSGFTGVDDAGSGTSSLTVSGTLTNSGTFRVGNSGISTALVVNITALNNTGSLELNGSNTSLSGSATLNVGSAAGFGSAGVVTGAVNLTGVSAVEFASGEITSIASGAQLNIQTSAGFIEDAGALGSNSALVGLASNAGQFLLRFGAALTTSGNFANSGFTGVDDAGSGGSLLTVSGTLTNSGNFQLGNGGISASAAVVNIAALNNIGNLTVHGRDLASGATAATLNVASAAGFGTTGVLTGTVNLNGLGSIDFAGGGEITSIAQNSQLNIQTNVGFIEDARAPGSNSALVGLASNAGQFLLRSGAALTTSGNLANSGFAGIDDGNSGGSSLTVGGTLTNSGGLQIGNTGISAATTVSATGLVNSGNINLNSKLGIARAVLSLVGPGTAGTAASLNTGAITSNTDGIAIGGGVRLVNGSSGSATGLITAGYAGVVLSNNGALVNYGTVKGTQTGVSLEPAGSATGAGVAVSNYGLLSGAVGIIDGGPSGTSDTVVNHGRVSGTSGAGIMLGGGSDRVDNFGTVSGANGTAVAFGGGGGTVVIEPGAVFSGVLGGLAKGDLIDFAHVSATGFGFAGGALTLFNHGTKVAAVGVTGTFKGADLALASDNNGGVEIGIGPINSIITGTYYTSVQLSSFIDNSATVTSSGRITSFYGDAVVGAAGTAGSVTNLGTIAATGSASTGVNLVGGGRVINGTAGSPGGYISGLLAGVMLGGAGGTVSNTGTIKGGQGVVIAGGTPATLTNAGTIIGTGGTAVSLAGGTNRLILAPGASFQGKADGGGGNSVVEVATSLVGLGMAGGPTGAADTAAAIYVSLGSVSNFSALQVDPGAATDADGNLSFGTLVNQGQINLLAGDSLVVGTVAGAAAGGTIDLKSGGSVHFTGAVAAGQTVLFRPPGGSVAIDHPEEFAAAITQFAATDVIDLPMGTASFQQYAGGVLSLNYNGQAVALQLATTAATPQFQFTPDAQGGTDISVSDTAPCFCRGTRVLTARGEVAVEDLRVGDRAVTLSGALKPVVWIGMGRDLVTRANKLARPVIVRAGALADGVPHRDLHLTHGHALYLDSAIGGALIPVEHLVNHKTIRWDERAQVVEYYHIELEDHDVLLAEGAPAESYYDAGNRAAFQNARPGSTAAQARPTFAPVLQAGEVVEAVWARLLARAGGPAVCDMTADPDLHLLVDGERLDPEISEGGVYRFLVPRPPNASLLLRSRAGVPSLLGQGRSDHRPLGVAITQFVIEQVGIATWLDYDQPPLREAGCYRHEDGFAWTDGDLALPARFLPPLAAPFTLTVRTEPHPELRYPLPVQLARAAGRDALIAGVRSGATSEARRGAS